MLGVSYGYNKSGLSLLRRPACSSRGCRRLYEEGGVSCCYYRKAPPSFFHLFCRSIHPIINAITKSTSSTFSALPFSIPCHFEMHPRQQVAVACCAMNTGCPLIGVCLPSFFGKSGAILVFTNWKVCSLMVSRPLAVMYSRSF